MAANPDAALENVLAALGLDLFMASDAPVRTARIADKDSRPWIERIRQETGIGF